MSLLSATCSTQMFFICVPYCASSFFLPLKKTNPTDQQSQDLFCETEVKPQFTGCCSSNWCYFYKGVLTWEEVSLASVVYIQTDLMTSYFKGISVDQSETWWCNFYKGLCDCQSLPILCI